jgi:hypothetical protein
MNAPRKHGLAFYGAILSAIHFTAAGLFSKVFPLLMLRPEDMVGSGDVKPYWPPSRLRDAVQGAGDILSLPASRVYDFWPSMPDAAAVLLFILSSCLWGFALALILRALFTWLRLHHEPHPA